MIATLTFIYDRRGRATKTTKGAVELCIYVNKKRKYISTGVRLFRNEWRNGAVTGAKEGWNELNEQLHLLYKRVSEIITRQMELGQLDLNAIPNLLKSSFVQEQTFIEYVMQISDRRVRSLAEGTRKRYKVFLDYLKEWKVITYFSDLTERNVLRMDDDLRERGLKEASRYNYHKMLRIFVREAMSDGLLEKNPYAKLKIKRGEENGIEKYLTKEEFARLCKVKTNSPTIEKVRDLFMFQTYTMMSYSDLEAFDYKACSEISGQLVYQAPRCKTGQLFTIVIVPSAKKILEKYNYKLPIISDQKYNMFLKSLAVLAKIDKVITSHWARHTGATLLRNDGVGIEVISKMLGHSNTRITEKVYAKLHTETIVRTMANHLK